MQNVRFILRALIELTEGRDVVLVSEQRAGAIELARKVCKLARAMHIPCANLGADFEDGPRIYVRAYSEAPKLRRFGRPTSVLFTAAFETTGRWALLSRCRLVVTTTDGRIPSADAERAVDKLTSTGLP